MVSQYGRIHKGSSKISKSNEKVGKSLALQNDHHDDEALGDTDLDLKRKLVEELLNGLDLQDLKELKQKIQTKQKTGQFDEQSNVWEGLQVKWKNELWILHGEDSALRLKPEVSQYPVALFTWDDWLEKVRETLLNNWFNPDTIVAMLLDWATNAMMPTFDWWLIEDHKTRFSYINKAIKLLGWEKKEPVTIKIEPFTQPQHFI